MAALSLHDLFSDSAASEDRTHDLRNSSMFGAVGYSGEKKRKRWNAHDNHIQKGCVATAARANPDQKVGSSNLSGFN